jgi:ABC-type transport system substrate-binding protein
MRRSTSTRAARVGALFGCAILLTSSCGTQQTPSPGASTSLATVPPAAPSPIPSLAYADTLRIGGVDWGYQGQGMYEYRQASNGDNPGVTPFAIVLGSLVHSALYRYDAHYNAIPDLADGPCAPQGDRTVIRCRLIETTFHDGTPLTADDVVYTYGVFQRTWSSPAVIETLKEARAVEPRTVDFVLSSVDPTFLTSVLPSVPILPRHGVEAAYADFVAATKGLTSADLSKLAATIDEEVGRDPKVCTTRLDEVASILPRLGVHLYREDFSRGTGNFQACTYMGAASWFIGLAASALETASDPKSSALDAVAAAFQLLSTDWEPVGTGPYRFVSEDANRVHLEAWPGYHGGLAATRYVDFVPTKADGSDLLAGTVDILQYPELGAAYEATASERGVRMATAVWPGFYGVQINVRAGRVFADRALRQALQLCIDLPRDVDAATGGSKIPAYGALMPGSWADDPGLPRPTRDTGVARALIEGAGWRAGADGIYTKGGVRLAADLVHRGDLEDPRAKMADLIATNARDCGMDLSPRSMSWPDTFEMLNSYPHNLPGSTTPFDLYMGYWLTEVDPDDGLSVFTTANVSDAAHPDGVNFGGFSDPAFDALIAAGKATYDLAERTRIYRQAQEELAAQVPYIFLWANGGSDVLRAAVATVDGPLDLSVPNWSRQPERMVVAALSP